MRVNGKKASEVIAMLETAIAKHGDLEVVTNGESFWVGVQSVHTKTPWGEAAPVLAFSAYREVSP